MATSTGKPADEKVPALGSGNLSMPLSQIIHTVKFKSCECPRTSVLGAHQLITNYEIKLDGRKGRDDATAISYAWGEFERTERLVGHDSDGNDIHMTLGEEWDATDFVNLLASLSERRPCWIDQLCIPQKDADVRRALASIPTIYRSLDVVALMPGAPCKCLRDRLEDLKVAEEFSGDDGVAIVKATLRADMARCHNVIPCSSWFKRVWTRQELLYSRRISIAWTGSSEAPCVELKTHTSVDSRPFVTTQQALDLSPFARLLHRQASKKNYDEFMGSSASSAVKRAFQTATPSVLLNALPALTNTIVDGILSKRPFGDSEASRELYEKAEEDRRVIEGFRVKWAGFSDMIATGTVDSAQTNLYLAAEEVFKEHSNQNGHEVRDDISAFSKTVRFFSGEVIEREMEDTDDMDGRIRLERFLYGLGCLRTSGRVSTQARDYINSVWVDCPGFRVPNDYKTMDLPTLFESALAQLRANHSCTIPTTIPSGLLGSTHETAIWKPSLYLSKSAVRNAAQVYGPMTFPFKPVPTTEGGMIPLTLTGAGFLALSSRAVDYENNLKHCSTRDMFASMKAIVGLWPKDLAYRNSVPDMEHVAKRATDNSNHPSIAGRAIVSALSTLASNLTRITLGQPDNVHEELQKKKHAAMAEAEAEKESSGTRFTLDLLKTRWGQRDLDWGARREVNHFKLVYQMVADALGLEYEMCRSRRLRLMASPDPPCIGLTNRDIYTQNARLRAGEDGGYDQIKTVCVTRGGEMQGSTLYEVERVENTSGPPLYRVFGVWVPLVLVMDEFRDCIFAEAEVGGADGYIV